MSEVADILNRAADLLEKPGAWHQGSWFDTSSTRAIADGDYSCMCAEGALVLAIERGPYAIEDHPAFDVLTEFVGGSIVNWNDEPGRTQAEVVATFREAAKSAA